VGDMLKLISIFPRMVEEEDIRDLFWEISLNELQVVIGSLKRDKNLGPNGWNVEFYKDLFDIIGEDHL
jgi:hypothetical protein